MEPYAVKARDIGNAFYPEIVSVLGLKPPESHPHFEIVFAEQIWQGAQGDARASVNRDQVFIDADKVEADPASLENVLVHEMTHIAQNYRGRNIPHEWQEGIATFVEHQVLGAKSGFTLQCTAGFPHYSDGYRCAAAASNGIS